MSSNTEHRRLAAIMFTDMVGYSALAQRDEALALELLEEHRAVLRSVWPRFNGVEVKTIGDAFLVEFTSALEAAQCAIEIQRALARRNTEVRPDRQIHVRIGIHAADVVHRDGDIYGDGVNIASRIEPLAGPGGICISMDVERQLGHALEAPRVRLPAARLKNIAAPMDLFHIVLPWEKPQASPSRLPAPERPVIRPLLLSVALVALLVTLGIVLALRFRPGGSPARVTAAPTGQSLPVPSPAAAHSVAVLPFLNLSPERKDDYLSDGITEELTGALSQVKGLRVPARTSAFVFKGTTQDVRSIGQQLNVATVLEGSVSQADHRLRISAQLINVHDGFHLWATNYEREMEDVFALRTDIAQQVVAALKVQLGVGESERLRKEPTQNPEAYRLYLEGRFWWNKRTLEGLQEAIRRFHQAIALDPEFALAYAGLADAQALQPLYGPVATKDCYPEARAAAMRAVELDPDLPEGHASLGLIRCRWEWDWQGAEKEFQRALELNPRVGTTHHWYSLYLRVVRRFEESLAEMKAAEEVDPLSAIIGAELGEAFIVAHQPELAVAKIQESLRRHPDFFFGHCKLSRAYLECGRYPEAIQAARRASELAPDSQFASVTLAVAYARAGEPARAREILQKMLDQSGQTYVRPAGQGGIADVCLALGDIEATLRWLEKGLNERAYGLGYINVDPAYERLRSDARFLALLDRMGLAR